MKAQSELAGDRERRAETTRPRFSGVTKWTDSLEEMNRALDHFDGIPKLSTLAETVSGIATIATPAIGILDNERVTYRPASR